MPSPFPGMDPYLEDPKRWPGVHTALVVAVHAALNQVLPDGYVAEIDLYVWAGERPEDEPELARRKPDVFVPAVRRTGRRAGRASAAVALAPPTTLTRLPARHVRRNRRVRIVTADGGEVVTVLELLSPSNKRAGEDRTAYLAKRGECFGSAANFVEVDLLRDGDRMPMGEPRPPVADYYALIARADRDAEAEVWAWGVADAVPPFPIPLRSRTPPVPLDLRWCLDRVYDEGRYADKLDYSAPPVPALRPADAAWAADLLKRHLKKKRR